ncbi:MAG: hypothetical protein ACI8T1_002233 [Verrucomicrobiales bacterium]|jgi:hypothetical protein
MPKDDKSYAQAMREHEEEKKFLRKIRHRAFHPDYESPVLFRLAGYLVRLVILIVVVALVLFVRNRKYFNGEGFSESLKTEFDYFVDGEESTLPQVIWKNDQMLISYAAKGGPRAFFREIDLQRITARAKWSDLMLNDGWHLQHVEIGDAVVRLKAGLSSEAASASEERIHTSSWFNATPDFNQTRFGEITLHNASFEWGPYWTSMGSLKGCSGTMQRKLGNWSLSLGNATFTQNWLRDLTMFTNKPMSVELKDDKIAISNAEFKLGDDGKVIINGIIQLGETPEFDLKVSMKYVDLTDIIPEMFHLVVAGLADIEMTITGSPNRSDGMIFEGEMTMVQSGRLRDIPILRTLSVITPRTEMRLMPIRSGSTLKFKTRQGLLTVPEINFQGGGAAVNAAGFKTDDGEVLDFARIVGGFTYQMDTSTLDESLKLESIKTAIEEDVEEAGPEVGFKGGIRIGMPWALLGKEEAYREKHFTPDKLGYGWIDARLEGTLDEITKEQSKVMDIEWTEIERRAE